MNENNIQKAWAWIEQNSEAKNILHKAIGMTLEEIQKEKPEVLEQEAISGFPVPVLLDALVNNDAQAMAAYDFLRDST